jgi:branched-subunit amino acid transport protein
LPSTASLVLGVAVLAVGTFAIRVAGPLLQARTELSDRARELTDTATVVLLSALVVTAALVEGGSPAGVARPVGVVVGGVLAWRRAPFVVVVAAAAATTALLRLVFDLP